MDKWKHNFSDEMNLNILFQKTISGSTDIFVDVFDTTLREINFPLEFYLLRKGNKGWVTVGSLNEFIFFSDVFLNLSINFFQFELIFLLILSLTVF